MKESPCLSRDAHVIVWTWNDSNIVAFTPLISWQTNWNTSANQRLELYGQQFFILLDKFTLLSKNDEEDFSFCGGKTKTRGGTWLIFDIKQSLLDKMLYEPG